MFFGLTRLDLSDSSIVCQLFQEYFFHRSPWKKEHPPRNKALWSGLIEGNQWFFISPDQQNPKMMADLPVALVEFRPSGTDGNVPTFGPFHQAWQRYNASNPPRCNDDKPSTYRCRLIPLIPLIPSWERSHIPSQPALLKMMFLFPRWDMLVPWRVVEKVIDPKWCVAITLHGEEKWFTSSQCKSQHNSRGFFY